MKIDILNFTTYNLINEHNKIDQLIGSQCIYPLNLQNSLINTFGNIETFDNLNNSNNSKNINNTSDTNQMITYCFEINNVCLFPKYTYDSDHGGLNFIVVSDVFYNKYFTINSNLILNILYDIPIVRMLKLRRIDGNFPNDDSIIYLLTSYLEESSVVSYNQTFELDYGVDKITFSIDEIIYKTNYVKNIEDRLIEINYLLKFNTNLAKDFNFDIPVGMNDCESLVKNYKWNYHDIGNKQFNVGMVANNEVEIDFVISEPVQSDSIRQLTQPDLNDLPIIPLQIAKHQHSTEKFYTPVVFSEPGLKISDTYDTSDQKKLTKDELRAKRSLFYNKK